MNFEIVDIEEFSGSMAKIYSIMLDGDDLTLLDHFLIITKNMRRI